MLQKESETVSEGSDPVHEEENSGLANPRWRMNIER